MHVFKNVCTIYELSLNGHTSFKLIMLNFSKCDISTFSPWPLDKSDNCTV